MAIEFKEIAVRMTAEQFARHELQWRGNRAKCPFTPSEERYNLAFYRDGKCHCMACGRGGDVVTLAAATWGVSQMEAAQRLNDEYRLGVAATGIPSAAMRQRQLERELKEAEAQEREERWTSNCDDLLPVIDDFRAACRDLQQYVGDDPEDFDFLSPEATAAFERCAIAEDRIAQVWARMTGGADFPRIFTLVKVGCES